MKQTLLAVLRWSYNRETFVIEARKGSPALIAEAREVSRMKSPLRLLILEDDPSDVELLRRRLSKEWPLCQVITANCEQSFRAVLEGRGFDIILSDYSIPAFDGLTVLSIARRECPHIPFLFVSGALGDEVAVECLKAGATDYVLKDRLARLGPAIRRALKEAEESARREQVEERLRERDEEYRDLFENTTDLIQIVTPEGRFLYVNRAWRQTLQYTEAEIAGLSIFDIIHPSYVEHYRNELQNAQPNQASTWETIFLTRHRQHLHVEGNISGRFCSGKLKAIRGIFRDVTERKLAAAALERSVKQYETLVNSVDGIVWQAQLPTLRFTFVSQQAERLLGYPVQRWLEEPDFWQRRIHPDDFEQAVALCQQLTAEQQHQNFEYRMIAADGRVVWFSDIVSVRDTEGDAAQIQGIMVDITSRKQAEAARRESDARLEQTNRDLVRRNQEIQNFYHTLSHELKTPLTSAREFIAILMDGLAGPLSKTQLEYLGIARDSCDQLRVCFNDLLDATRLETGKLALDLKPAPLVPLLHRVVTVMKPRAFEKKLALLTELPPNLPEIPMDEGRITQVVTNLLNNAIKYTPAGGTIVIKVDDAPGCPQLLQVSVSDTGRGIPPEEQERIFDRLYQVKAGDASTEQGVGLGLYLCRELVQLHGGSIRVESEPEKGSTFSFVLPKSIQLLHSHLLVVDDDPDMLELLRQVLVAERFNVRTARDGLEGLHEMRRQRPDLVILDLAMPKLSGAAMLKEMRKEWGPVPVIVHTGFCNSDLMKQALAFSPFTLLAKPCLPRQIVETVRKVQRSEDTAIWKKNHHGLQKLAWQ
jgi:PAS domain S-box-containing protein